MKKVLIGSIAASALAFGSFAMSVANANAAFSNYLHVGSTGADVSALQTWLVSKNFLSMPAGVSMGYFGSLTKAAVIKYQASINLPATGFVGPLTIAQLNMGATTGSTNGGAVVSNGGSTVMTNDGTDGSISAQTSSYVSSGIQMKKGDTKDVVAVRLQATSGTVTVTRADVHFNLRPWLVFNKAVLHDSMGKVIATKMISDSSSATEITVGTDYLVRFDGINYTVMPGTNPDLAVSVTVLPATDKITNGQIVNAAFGVGGIRTINGKGYTDSVSGAAYSSSASAVGISQLTGIGANNVTLQSSGSVADIFTRISPNSPLARQQVTSLTQTTNAVTLGTFSLKSANNSSTLNSVIININDTAATSSAGTYSNIRLVDGSSSYGGTMGSETNGSVPVTFTNLTVALAQDAWHDLSIVADIAQGTNGVATTSLVANTTNLVITDANYNTATIEAASPVSNNVTFTTNAVTVSASSATIGSTIVQSNNTVGYNVTYAFTLANNSNNDLFVSAVPNTFVGTSTTGTAGSSTLGSVISIISPSTYNGDVAGTAYVIPAGLSRSFSFNGAIRGTTGQNVQLKVTQINYGTASGSTATANINFGLEALSATANF
jgi:peptidoglycan hydrolase-like protein with peptidoglycan-binding domain